MQRLPPCAFSRLSKGFCSEARRDFLHIDGELMTQTGAEIKPFAS
jgi:hypothetical protein